MKRFLRVIAPFIIMASIFCIPSVTETLPEPMKTAFTELRENTIKLTTRAGYGKIEWNNPRGIFQGGDSGGVQHIGGR